MSIPDTKLSNQSAQANGNEIGDRSIGSENSDLKQIDLINQLLKKTEEKEWKIFSEDVKMKLRDLQASINQTTEKIFTMMDSK